MIFWSMPTCLVTFMARLAPAWPRPLPRGNDLLLDIDVQGAAQVRRNMPQAITIFILPPNPDVLERRLRNRSRAEGGVEESVVQKRLATARQEIEKYHEYRYVLVNDVLERAAEELSAIVIAERSAAHPADNDQPSMISELTPLQKTRRPMPVAKFRHPPATCASVFRFIAVS